MELVSFVPNIPSLLKIRKTVSQKIVLNCKDYLLMEVVNLVLSILGVLQMVRNANQKSVMIDKSLQRKANVWTVINMKEHKVTENNVHQTIVAFKPRKAFTYFYKMVPVNNVSYTLQFLLMEKHVNRKHVLLNNKKLILMVSVNSAPPSRRLKEMD